VASFLEHTLQISQIQVMLTEGVYTSCKDIEVRFGVDRNGTASVLSDPFEFKEEDSGRSIIDCFVNL